MSQEERSYKSWGIRIPYRFSFVRSFFPIGTGFA